MEYKSFVQRLQNLLSRALIEPVQCQSEIAAATNGLAKSELNRLVPQELRRADGIFFTDDKIAKTAAHFLTRELSDGQIICDPACGAGDLLLACFDIIAKRGAFESNLAASQSQLMGWDLHNTFIEACKLRLLLKCIEGRRSAIREWKTPAKTFSQIAVRDGLKLSDELGRVGAVIMNPPYTSVDIGRDVDWAKGKTNIGALFVETILRQMPAESKLVAILPDVLRSGARYSRWRAIVAELANVTDVIPLSQFDSTTDVHVFMLVATKKEKPLKNHSPKWATSPTIRSAKKLGDYFDVAVGPVVDYRDPKRGGWLPYLTARDLPRWQIVRASAKQRRFTGRQVRAPFVVVRRTSRPEDVNRAVGTIVGGTGYYAVDNHLIILKPKDGTLRLCRQALSLLQSFETNHYLNSFIRCRHLTVTAVSSIPWTLSFD